ncbi:MAG: bifunctional diaminohydroxyphosphoribosylaminopyrimidine deaminase/5-amino-6-(5-phosphoribosylamino)uracil reductase RibD [Myxococcota bacterium]|nr:bifunctional diaminohydroxyphosphoribosylaminopyrimidine deaminase/5-amino-6-(5-phosphoribosylamino)uracil reductase RibD [Myxococcota bacterium]
MRLLPRSKARVRRTPRAKRAADFDLAVAEFFMRIALEEAAKGVGRTSPNPAVGAILVKAGRIIARGYHQKAGSAHAEVVALNAAGAQARGADLYTTLEPCDHFGRTPPCSQAILSAGVRRVFCGSADPNPLVSGKGVARLQAAGVEVRTGILQAEADALNRPFFKAVTTGLPYVTLKAAVTLDGKLATATGDSKWVTGEEARLHVHRLRNRVDAVLVGGNTVRLDDPQLTTRLPKGEQGRDPVRVVVDSHLALPLSRKLFQPGGPRTIVATLEAEDSPRARKLKARGVEVWRMPSRAGRVSLTPLLRRLGREGLSHVLAEGGAELFASLIQARLADELWLFLAPKVLGAEGRSWAGPLKIRSMAKALATGSLQVERFGADLLLRASLRNDA